MKNEHITLDEGGGGYKSSEIVKDIRKILNFTGKWNNCGDDAALLNLGGGKKLVFTTDAFIVDPLFFPGGDIGKISMCGTINDLVVMGADPVGVSLSFVAEEGFPRKDFEKIVRSISKVSKDAGVPVVTGDTKVTEKGKIDKIEITTAGVGLVRNENVIKNDGIKSGDHIITSGDLGEHAVTLLAERFNYKTKIKSDCKAFVAEMKSVRKYINACKDPTRGGLAANLVEMAEKSCVKVILDEETLPYKKETIAVSEILGIDIFSLASEGRFIAAVSPKNVEKVIKALKKYDKNAKVIGKAVKTKNKKECGVFLKTELGSLRPVEMPKGKLIPRIC